MYNGNCMALYPYPELLHINDNHAEPSYKNIEAVCIKLNTNSAEIYSKTGHIVFTVGDDEYQYMSGRRITFTAPTPPPP